MITLVTAPPGTGKTALALVEMLKVVKQGTPLFVHGVPDLKLPHIAVACQSPSCRHCEAIDWSILYRMPSAETWHEWAPAGSILFFDECQHIFRPRPPSAAIPEGVSRLEGHRHGGIDFFMVTQHPKLIDTNVRRMVSKHIHLKSTWQGKNQYEWGECNDEPQNVVEAVKSTYKLDPKVFPLYKSAELHTKIQRKVPAQVYLVAACLVIVAVLGVKLVNRFGGSPQKEQTQAQKETESNNAKIMPDQELESSSQNKLDDAKFDYNPKIPNIPESAPAFVALANPSTFPRLAGCVVDKKEPEGCRCYTQQATPYFISPDQCRAYVKYGRFDPYKGEGGNQAPIHDAKKESTNPLLAAAKL